MMFRALAFLALATLALAGCAADSTAQDRERPASDRLVVARGDLERQVLLTGELAAEEAAVAVAPIVRIWPLQVRWIADDGSAVGAGEKIVEFDNSQLASRLEDLRTRVTEAQSQLDQAAARADSQVAAAELELERARAELEKAEIRANVPEGLVSAKELADRGKALEQARLELQEAETRIAARREGGEAAVADATLSLENAERELAQTEDHLDRLEVKAPREGVLVISDFWRESRPIRDGDQVWPGMTVARIPDLSTMVIHARVYDVDDGLVESGARIRARMDAFPDETFQGTVRHVERIAQPVSPTSTRRAFQAVIDLDELDPEKMRPGMSVKVVLDRPAETGRLLVPRRALIWGDEGPAVRLADGRSFAVRLGACSSQRCVLDEGPEEGTELAVEEGS